MSRTLIVAEVGINHQGNMRIAHNMVSLVKRAGADVFKTQLYDVDKLFPGGKIMAQGRNWYDEVKKTQLNKQQAQELADDCNDKGLEFMASAFDFERFTWLEEIGVRRHKVATPVNKNASLIGAMVATGKEVLVSCKNRSGDTCAKGDNVKYLYCIPEYPTSFARLKLYEQEFPIEFQGFSDHTIGIDAAMVSIVLGVRIIEKHFCFSRKQLGPDIICSATFVELRQLVEFAKRVEEMLR